MNTIRVRITARFLVLTLMLALMCTLGVGTASAATFKDSGSFPFSFYNNCTGEVVTGVVSYKTTVHEFVDASGGYHFNIHEQYLGKAVGETSGIRYVGPQTDHESFHVSSNGALEDTYTLNFRFNSVGSTDNILYHLLFHVTITPNGNFTSEILNITDTCRG